MKKNDGESNTNQISHFCLYSHVDDSIHLEYVIKQEKSSYM